MALPTLPDAKEATKQLDAILSGSQLSAYSDGVERDSFPPSPEIGMAREGRSVQGFDLEEGNDDDVPDIDLLTPPNTFKQDNIDEHNQDRADSRSGRQLTQEPAATSVRPANSEFDDLQPTNPDATCSSTRRSTRAKSALAYDQKYHPLDDFLRPSQAAKRRSIHGERPLLHERSGDESSEGCSSDFIAMVHDTEDQDTEDDNVDTQRPTSDRKRKRSKSRTPEPTRRSSRMRTQPKVSYNMKIHPQDSDLKRAYAYDGSHSSPSQTKQASHRTARSPSTEKCPDTVQEAFQSPPALTPDFSPELTLKPELNSLTQDSFNKEATREQAVKLGDVVPELCPDVAYLTGNQNPWPDVKGLPFNIYTERVEDQLNAEAEAASPLHHEDDDKENDITNPELVPTPNPLDGISIIPASHYERPPGTHFAPSHGSMADNAFYLNPQFEVLPYGLGWGDEDFDVNGGDTRDRSIPEYMRILASGESLPQTSTPNEKPSQENDAFVKSSPLRNITRFDLRR